MKKKLLFTLLGVLMVLPALARDFEYEYEGQTLTYTVIDEDAKTCKTKSGSFYYYLNPGNEVSGKLLIPEIAKDGDREYTVTAIGECAFSGCSGLTSVTIGNSVETISDNAFRSCDGLTDITIPESVTSIGDYAFSSCDGLTEITIPESVTSIGHSAFEHCSGLTEVTIGNSVTSIGNKAFCGCSDLPEVNIPNSVTSIGVYAFSSCSSLKDITISDGTETLSFGSDVFYSVDVENLYLGRNFTCPSSYPSDEPFYGKESLKELTIAESVTSICPGAFYGCSGLTSLTIPNSVTSIGASAFRDCRGLTSVIIGNSVETIGNFAFSNCPGLTSLIIPESVTSISSYTFYGCSGLVKSAYPNTLQNPFSNGIAVAYNPDGAIIEDGWIYGPAKSEIRFAPYSLKGDYVIPESVTSIGSHAFGDCSRLTSVTIPESVTSIGEYAFMYCGLTSVTIPNSVISIGSGAFSYCNDLETVNYNVENCYSKGPFFSNLKKLKIGEKVKTIPEYAFHGCRSLTEVTIGNSVKSIDYGAFNQCSSLTEVVLPPAVETIGAFSFADCGALSSIIMGANVKTIGEKAFDGCPAKTICITAQTPPTAPNNTFSTYSGKLYLQGEDAIVAYYDAFTCWDRFDSYLMIEATGIEYTGEKRIIGKPGDSFRLTATLMPENVTLPQIFWRSTNPAIATVDSNGLVTIHADLNEGGSVADDEEEPMRSCKIIAESLYADGPVLEVTVGDSITDIEGIRSDSAADSPIDFNAPLEIYTLSGLKISSSVEDLAPGIYIVRQGKAVRKISVK